VVCQGIPLSLSLGICGWSSNKMPSIVPRASGTGATSVSIYGCLDLDTSTHSNDAHTYEYTNNHMRNMEQECQVTDNAQHCIVLVCWHYVGCWQRTCLCPRTSTLLSHYYALNERC
jgi:hypothetical protein